jgi:hypothetical protein
MTKDEALDLALDYIIATNKSSEFWLVPASNLNKTVTAIKQARSAPVQKPYRPLQDNGSQYFGGSWDTPPTQPAPVQSCYCPNCEALSKELAAAQRQWVDLTNDEIALIHADNPHPQGFARAVLAKSKEKNNG